MSMAKRVIRQYVPPHRYTAEELLDADIADLEVDYQCAIRDTQPEYAENVRLQLEAKRALKAAPLSLEDRIKLLKGY